MSDLLERLRRMSDMTTTGNDLSDIGRAADEIERLQAEYQERHAENDVLFKRAVEAETKLAGVSKQLVKEREFSTWVATWVSNPVGAYSVSALDGLFGMTRDKLAHLTDDCSKARE